MGRQENVLDPDAGPVQRFAFELRMLRRSRDGITYRAMARRVGYSAPALSQAAAGERMPSLAVTLAYVTACGGDVREWERRWRQANAAVATAPGDDASTPPFVGLAQFEETDRDRFFGRDKLVADVVALVRQHPFVAVVGASGTGKSSLLRAGVLPLLRESRPGTVVAVVTPGAHPVRAYDCALPQPVGEVDTVVVVDQFEELFTLCANPEERARFVELLLAARRPESRLRVIVVLRADFYGRCAEHPALGEAVREAQVLVGPMTASELREVIVRPAAAAGLIVQRALTARLIDEVVNEPGGLPLVSHVLLETWRRRRGRSLTVEGYQAAGGVRGALAKTAEQVYSGLSPAQSVAARRILLRLVMPGEGVQATRRPARRAEFDGARRADVDLILRRLAEARLIILDGGTVDLAHEALITAWPRLTGWIQEQHRHLRLHRQLTEAAGSWAELGRDPGALYRGVRLALGREWIEGHSGHGELNSVERAFIEASIAAEGAERAAQARQRRRLRRLAAGLAVALLVVTGLAGVALAQRRDAVAARQTAISRQLAAESLGLKETAPGTAMLLSVAAFRTAPTTEARGALLSMAAYQAYQGELTGHTDAIADVGFGQDGNLLASVSRDEKVIVWDVLRKTRRTTLTDHPTWLRAVSFSPDGRLLATGGDNANVVLWNAERGERLATLSGHADRIRDIDFSPDGRQIATSSNDHTVILWDLRDRIPVHRLTGHQGVIQGVAFSPDGNTVATAGGDRTIGLWDTATGARLATLTGHAGTVDGIAFSPDGRILASASTDHAVRLWDVASLISVATLTGHTDQARAVAFSPDGRTLASAGHDNTIILWDVASRTVRARLTGHTNNIYTLAFHPTLPLLASGEENGRILLWDTDLAPLGGHTGQVTATAFSPDGRTIATAATDRTVILWDAFLRAPVATIRSRTGPANSVAFSHDGRVLAIGTGSPRPATGLVDGGVLLMDITSRAVPVELATLTGHTDQVKGVAFTPDDGILATASPDQAVILWDTHRYTKLAVLHNNVSLSGVAISPDGRTLAVSSGHNRHVILWSLINRTRLATLNHDGLPRGLAFSPDSRSIATVGMDRTVTLWDVERHTPTATFTHNDTLNNVAFSPDGRLLATGGVENTVGLWDSATGTRLATLTGHTGPVNAVAFAPDGHTLASADRRTIMWTTDAEQAVREICRIVRRDLSQEELNQFFPSGHHPPTCG